MLEQEWNKWAKERERERTAREELEKFAFPNTLIYNMRPIIYRQFTFHFRILEKNREKSKNFQVYKLPQNSLDSSWPDQVVFSASLYAVAFSAAAAAFF